MNNAHPALTATLAELGLRFAVRSPGCKMIAVFAVETDAQIWMECYDADSPCELMVLEPASSTANPAAVALGRLGGLKGGNARAEALSPERRKEISSEAAKARWSDKKAVPVKTPASSPVPFVSTPAKAPVLPSPVVPVPPKVDPLDATSEAVLAVGRKIKQPFTADELHKALQPLFSTPIFPSKAYSYMAVWNNKRWVKKQTGISYVRTETFGRSGISST